MFGNNPARVSPASPTPASAADSWRRDLLVLAVVFGALYLFLLGRPALVNPDEGRYAEIPREMIATGDWVTPRLDGVNYFEKPPLMYWVVAACIRCLGPGEFPVRLAPPVFAAAGVLLAYAATRRLFGRPAGIGAAVVLGTSAFYAGLARLLILDMVVSVLMSATLFCFILGINEPAPARRRWFFHGLYASAALATLTKGLMGFLVTGAVMFLWLLVFNQWKRLRPMHLPSGLILFLAIAAPWHMMAAARNPDWAHFYFINQHWERFTTTQHARFHPWYWFIPIVLGGLFPWVGFLGQAWRAAGGWVQRRENAEAWFFVVWAVFIFVFFSKSQSKLAPYILPVFPPLAVLIGRALSLAWQEPLSARIAPGTLVFTASCSVLAGAVAALVGAPERFGIDPGASSALRPAAFAMAAVLASGAFVAAYAALRRRTRAALGAIGLTMVLFLGIADLAASDIYRLVKPSTKELALWVRANVRPGDRIFFYADFFHDFLFYSGQPAGAVGFHGDEIELQNDPAARAARRFIEKPEFLAEWNKPGRVLVVAPKSRVDTRLLLSDPAFHYRLLDQTPSFILISNK